MAGLWEHWKTPEGSVIETCTIITTAANRLMAAIHERMPVILAHSQIGAWLDISGSPDTLTDMLRPCGPDMLEAYRVSNQVNSPRFDSPECIARV
jgi:putative SOS response-associated peptidase YedK